MIVDELKEYIDKEFYELNADRIRERGYIFGLEKRIAEGESATKIIIKHEGIKDKKDARRELTKI